MNQMKKTIAIVLACLVAAMLFAGCGPSTDTPKPVDTKASEQTPDVSEGKKAASDLKVVVITTDALGGGGVPDDMNNNLKKAIADFGINGSIYEATDTAQYEEILRSYSREGVDLIITTFPEMVEAVTKVSKEFPDVKYSIMLPLKVIDSPNVRSVEFACWELYYLAGIVAGYMTEGKTVGHVIGAEQGALIANNNAYREGLLSVTPDAKIEVINANSFNDPAIGKDVGLTLISKGCDVILTDCSNTASGVIEACKENAIYVVGDSGEHYHESPEYVLGDTQCHYGPATYEQIKDLVNGDWKGGLVYVDLKTGSISLEISPVIRDNLPKEKLESWDAAMAAVKDAIEKINSGELVIEMNPEWAK